MHELKSAKNWSLLKCFWSQFSLHKPSGQHHYAGTRIEASLRKKTEVRDGFMQTGTPSLLCSKHSGWRVKLPLWPFCGWIPGATKTIWARFDWYKFQWMPYFAGRTGWPDTCKKCTNGYRQFHARGMEGLPGIIFGKKTRHLRRPGIEPGSTAWKAAMLTTKPPTHWSRK